MTGKRAAFDEFGNPIGGEYDFGGGDEARLSGETILFYSGLAPQWHGTNLQAAVAQRNIRMDVRHAPDGACDLDASTLSRYTQLWYLSGANETLSKQQIDMIADYVRRGNGLAIWADNEPLFADANLLAARLIGTRFSGNKMADHILVPGERLSPGHFIEHPLTQGVNNLYEGVTICTIAEAPNLKLLAQSHDGQICMAAFERGQERIVLDSGFTKLHFDSFERTAGTARYLRNIAFWLARGSRSVEYKLFTPGRENLATVGPGGLSDAYKFTVTQPCTLTYILTWTGAATLGLLVRDPHGRTVYDAASGTSPIRIELPAEVNGDWLCQVKGVRVPQPDFPYVLTLALERNRVAAAPIARADAAPPPALPTAPIQPAERPAEDVTPPTGTYLPVFLVLDVSAHAAPLASNVAAGVDHFVTRLRGRPSSGTAAYLGIYYAGAGGLSDSPPVSPAAVRLPALHAAGAFRLGAALRNVLAHLPSFAASGKPLVVVLLAGAPEDDWIASAGELRALATSGSANVLVLTAGDFDDLPTLHLLSPTPPLAAGSLTHDQALRLFEWLYSLVDGALSALASGVKRVQAATPPDFVRTLG